MPKNVQYTASSGTEKIARVQQLGADVVIDYRQEDVAQRLQEITGNHGVDVVFETVGGDLFQAILTAIAPEGRWLFIGAASGVILDVSIMTLLAGNFAMIGTDFAYYTLKRTDLVQQSLSTLLDWSADGFFDAINLQTATLEQAADVIEQVHQGDGACWYCCRKGGIHKLTVIAQKPTELYLFKETRDGTCHER